MINESCDTCEISKDSTRSKYCRTKKINLKCKFIVNESHGKTLEMKKYYTNI